MSANASYGLTAPTPQGAAVRMVPGGAATTLVEVTPPKVVERGPRQGDVDVPGTSIRACADCAARLTGQLEAKRAEEERIREEKANARREAAAERRKAARANR